MASSIIHYRNDYSISIYIGPVSFSGFPAILQPSFYSTAQPLPIMAEEKPLPFVYQFAAGAIAGVSEILVMYPLDVVKTRVQLQTKAAAGAEAYNGMLDCFRKIIKTEGASRLYRGITAPILMEAPKRATKFAANDEWGKVYRKMFGVPQMTQGLSVLTGATAGATESFVVVPFELVKIRLQDKASAGKYNGMVDCVVKTVRAEGPLALYQGLESTMWRHILWNAGYFGCIFQVRQLMPKADTKSGKMTNDLISGAVGGTVGTILNTPLDVVKSRIQNTPRVPGQIPKYNWAFPAVLTVAKEEGFAALYKGFLPKVLRLGPGGGILLVVFTTVMDTFRKWQV
jgi:solute carrier family 25 2-oxodicarboxylate transporter 21